MKTKLFFISFLILVMSSHSSALAGKNQTFDRVHISFTLSGHLLFGVGFEHGFTNHHALRVAVFPLLIPGKGLPFAFKAGYNYYTGGSRWKGKLGADVAILVSPPDPQKRKIMPMIVITPGLQYALKEGQYVSFQPWLAWFFKETNRKFGPIGLEFTYDYSL